MRVEKGKLLSNLTTLEIGGPASFFVIVRNENDLKKALVFAKDNDLKFYILGEGSNIVASDSGWEGLIIKNSIKEFKNSKNKIYVGAGNNLLDFIKKVNKLGLAGFEKMAGIPGTIAGAIYGNAGAYGQEIKDNLSRVKIFDLSAQAGGKKVRWIKNLDCKFEYRESIFKKNKDWIILGAEFHLATRSPSELKRISSEIVKLREKRYKPGLKCPGSFFKNIIVANLRPVARKEVLSKINPEKIMYGKIPSGYLLDEAGAKGITCGYIKVAEHHGNLIYNEGGGRAIDVKKLAVLLKDRVEKRFGVVLEEEVQYLE